MEKIKQNSVRTVFLLLSLFIIDFSITITDLFAGYDIRSSSVQENNRSFNPENMLDQNMQTRWSSRFNDKEWVEIDFKTVRELVGLRIFWEAAYGKIYNILLSRDGQNWVKVYSILQGGRGLYDDIYFGRRSARYLKLDFLERGTPWGYSIREINFKDINEEIKVTSSSFHNGYSPDRIMDTDLSTSWKSGKKLSGEWIMLEIPAGKSYGGLAVQWGNDQVFSYDVEVSPDKKNWKNIYSVIRTNSDQNDDININIIHQKYLRLLFRPAKDRKEYEIRELELKEWDQLANRSSLAVARGLTGHTGYKWKTIIGKDGSFAPEPYPVQAGFWVYDKSNNILYTPETGSVKWTLENGRIPVDHFAWTGQGIKMETTIFSRGINDRFMINFARLKVTNTGTETKELVLYLKIQSNPLMTDRGQGITSIDYGKDQWIRINNRPLFFLKNESIIINSKADTIFNFPVMKPGERLMFNNKDGKALFGYKAALPAKSSLVYDILVPAGLDNNFPVEMIREYNFTESHQAVKEYWENLVPVEISVPDKEWENCFYTSVYYILLMMDGDKVYPGPVNYKSFFLHDAVEMTGALDKAGLTQVAEKVLNNFIYQEKDGYQDGLGGSIFGLYDHYRLTRDINYLKKIYPRILHSCEQLRKLRSEQLKENFINTAVYGLLPPAVSQDNFNYPAHLYLDNWWALIGFKCGHEAAALLNKKQDKEWIAKEYSDLKKCILKSITLAMERDRLPYMPAFADYWPPEMHVIDADHRILGEAQMATAHHPALYPGQSLGIDIPQELFIKSYKYYWDTAGKFSNYDGAWFVEYEKVFWGYNTMLAHLPMYLGMNEVTLKNIEWCIKNQSCPGGWMEAMPAVKNDQGLWQINEGIIGDVPHGWVAGYYALLIRNILLREENQSMHLLSCIPETWLDQGKVIEVKNILTCFGPAGFKMESFLEQGYIKIEFYNDFPEKNDYIFHNPLKKPFKKAEAEPYRNMKIFADRVIIPAQKGTVKIFY